MEIAGNMMTARKDINVLDATLRDGGLVNDFYFSDDFVKAIFETNIKANVDYMEFGYKADKDLFDASKFGKWKFCKDEDIRSIVGANNSPMKISVMADVGRCNYKRDVRDRVDSPIDMIRVATYINTIPEAISMIEYANDKGYETTCNIMAISKVQESDLDMALDMLAVSPVNGVYIVDSYGSLYPIQIREIAKRYLDKLSDKGKFVGIHAHNNQQSAFCNTIEAMSLGVSYLDSTIYGMGRGAGNCTTESLLGYLKNPKYDINPVLKFIQKYMLDMRKENTWGYDLPYLLTGLTDRHPRSAIAAIKNADTDYFGFYQSLLD